MTNTRLFTVEINSEFRKELKIKFATLFKGLFENASGCNRLTILKPTKWAPDEYSMI